MTDFVFAIPGDLATPTGGYVYDREILARLPSHGIAVRHLALDASFPDPTPQALSDTAAAFATLPAEVPLMVDGLAFGAMPAAVIDAAGPRPLIALVHHPLGLESGLAPDRAEALIASETAALARADRVVATSAFTARLLAERFGVPRERLHVAPPGTDPAPRVVPRQEGRASLLAIGAATPRKGYDVLVRALGQLSNLDWHLTIVGALDRTPVFVTELRDLIGASGLEDRIALAGALPPAALEGCYAEADILVSPSLFEGYGMALAEALARGLPIVMSRGGAADETVPDAAALKTAPGDVVGLATALRSLIGEPEGRVPLAEASWEAGHRLPTWTETAAEVAAAVVAARNIR